MILALNELKIDTSGLKELVFDPKKTFLRVPHEGFHTDFLPEMKGLAPFRECKKNAKGLDLDGITVYILSLEDLILKKKRSIALLTYPMLKSLKRLEITR